MTYSQYGTIQASDYNTFVGGNPTGNSSLNAVWATGSGSAGYGQTALANVAVGATVAASDWANLVNKTANSASHQGTSISAVTAPSTGGTVTYLSGIPTNITSIFTNRFNAASQGSTSSNAATYGSSWSHAITFAHTVSFANGDAARYFFNSGGQIKLTMSHSPTTTTMDTVFHNLASNVGTIVMSSPASGTATIVGVSYNGITKIGGGGNSPTLLANNGYYALTTSNAAVFTQVATGAPTNYTNTDIVVNIKSNGTQGSNGDVGNIITIYSSWAELRNTGLTVSSGSTVSCTAVVPETTYIANTWGAITLSGTVTGS